MQTANIKEYSLLRSDVESVKSCITQYVGFLLTGSSITLISTPLVGYYVLSKPDVISTGHLEYLIGFVAYFLSMITSLVSLLIFYKFNSHNRYSGYLMMLTGELWNQSHAIIGPAEDSALHESPQSRFDLEKADHLDKKAVNLCCAASWEWCSDRVRLAEMDSVYSHKLRQLVDDIGSPDLASYYGEIEDCRAAKKGAYRGLKLLLGSIFWKGKTRSWSFPFPITSILVLLCTMFLLIGLIFTWLELSFIMNNNSWILKMTGKNVYIVAITIPVVIAYLIFWKTMFRRLYRLMHEKGDRTVRAYCIRFLAPRSEYLRLYGITCEWNNFFDR